MAFVRTITYTFPYDKIEEVTQSGTDIFMRLVPAHKLLTQESNGMLDTGVWVTQLRDGTLRVVSFTKWYSVEDLTAFGNDPDVHHHETTLSQSTTNGAPDIEVYQVMG